jgi:putative heme degradation protein
VEKKAAAPAGGPLIVPDRNLLTALWRGTRHETGGFYFPGMPGVKRITALQCAGHDLARKITFEQFTAAIVAARRYTIPLACHLFNAGLSQRVVLTPGRVERCHCGLHVFDTKGEIHIRPRENLTFWAIRTSNNGAALEWIDDSGVRSGMMEFAGTEEQKMPWVRMLFS